MATKKKLPSLSPALTDEVLRFIEYHPAKRFDKNLRKLLIDYSGVFDPPIPVTISPTLWAVEFDAIKL